MNSQIYYGDCLDVMAKMADDSIDLIVTSPPYADARKHTYGGVAPDEYVDWFLPRAEQMKRIMKPTGSFVLNIKEKCSNGERHIYVLKLIITLKEQLGFKWVDEYCWHKAFSYPGRYPNRLRDGWERLLHFTKQNNFKMRQNAVMRPAVDGRINPHPTLIDYEFDKLKIFVPKSNSGLVTKNIHNNMVLPDNVLYLAPEKNKQAHSAPFPKGIPEFFIKLFTDKGDVVLDPFLGSGTTYRVAECLGRIALGIEILEEYAFLHQPDSQQILL